MSDVSRHLEGARVAREEFLCAQEAYREAVLTAHRAGVPIRAIARALEISPSAVLQQLRKLERRDP